jgi:hypothetical protein
LHASASRNFTTGRELHPALKATVFAFSTNIVAHIGPAGNRNEKGIRRVLDHCTIPTAAKRLQNLTGTIFSYAPDYLVLMLTDIYLSFGDIFLLTNGEQRSMLLSEPRREGVRGVTRS